jgi:mannosylfructose-phosphate synthase
MQPGTSQRILMISTHGYVAAEPELGRPDTGGQVVYVLRLSEHLARLGYAVDIFTRRFEDQAPTERVADGVRIIRIPAGGDGLIRKEVMCEVIPEWIANAERFIEASRLQYSFVDSHYWDAGLAGLGLARRFSLPHLHTPHSIGAWKRDTMDGDPEELDRQYNFRRRIRDERRIYASSDLLLATSPQQHEILRSDEYAVADERIAVIPPGYDDSRFFPVSSASREALKRDLGLEGPIVLALGRVAANKGYDLLVRAFRTVVERVPDSRLLLGVGSTDPTPGERAQVRELARLAASLGVGERVLIRDYIPDERLADHYRAADVFALSSRYEPFGMTAVEAMACGTPTVVTTQGGLWEMLTWGLDGVYADPFDPPAFGHAIATVLAYPRVAGQLARGGAERARARFTWTGIAQQVLGLLDVVERAREPAEPATVAASSGVPGVSGARAGAGLEWTAGVSS